jgi:hypothetical protein
MCIGRYIHRLIMPASRGFASLRQPSKCGIMIHYLVRDVNAVTHVQGQSKALICRPALPG